MSSSPLLDLFIFTKHNATQCTDDNEVKSPVKRKIFSRFSRENTATQCTDDDLMQSPKRTRMEFSTPASNNTPCIKIEQLVKHDVWDIRRKDDGAFVMKKLPENDTGASPANTGTLNLNAGNRANAEQTGARPKVIVEVPKMNNTVISSATNRLQNVIHERSTVTIKPVNAPRMTVPEKKVITLTPINPQKNSVITINTTPAPLKGPIITKTTAQENQAVKLNAGTAPRKEVITINATPSPKKEVITISATPSPKREVITINTRPFVKPAVFTINTSSKKEEEPATSQIKDSTNMRKHTMHNIWNVPKEENRHPVANTANKDSGPSVTSEKSDSGVQSSSISFIPYADEVYQIQEMFPQIPLSVISENLRVHGSVESTIDSLLAQAFEEPMLSTAVPPTAPTAMPPTAPTDDDDVVFVKSVKADKPKTDIVSGSKKEGSVIRIELLTKSEVWDIKRDKEGFVLKKAREDGTEEGKTESQSNKPGDSVLCADDSVEVMEEEHDPLLDDIFLDAIPRVGNSEQSNAPVKLMVYSQSSDTHAPISKVTTSGEGNVDSAMEVDSFDNSCSVAPGISVEAFEFSDDENEDSETVEHFLFKASLVLVKLKYRCESEIVASEDSELLNITGSMKNEETDEAKEVCSDDGDNDDDNDDDGDNNDNDDDGDNNDNDDGGDNDDNDDDGDNDDNDDDGDNDDEYYTDEGD